MEKIKVHVTCGEPVIELHKVLRVGPIRIREKNIRYVVHLSGEPKRKVKFYTFEGCGIIQATNVIRNCRFNLITKLVKYHNNNMDLSKFGDDDTFTVAFEPKTIGQIWIDKLGEDVTNLEMLNEIRDIYKAIIKRNEQDDALHKSKTADMQKAYAEINEAMQQLGTEKSKLFTMLMETKDKRHQRYVEMERRLVDMVKSCQNIKREVENMFANIETKISGFDKEGRLVIKTEAVKEMTELLPYQKSLNAAILYLQNFLFDFGGPDEERRQLSLLKDADEAIASLIREMRHMRIEDQSYYVHSAKTRVEEVMKGARYTQGAKKAIQSAVDGLIIYRDGIKSREAEPFTGLKDIFKEAVRTVGNYGRSPGWIKAMEEGIGRNTAGGGNYKPATDWRKELERNEFPGLIVHVIQSLQEGENGRVKRDIGENDVQKAIRTAADDMKSLLQKAEYEQNLNEDSFYIPVAKAFASTAYMYNTVKANCQKEDFLYADRCLDHMREVDDIWKKYKKQGLFRLRDQVIKAIQYLEKIAYGSNDQPKQEQEPTPDEKLSVDGEMLKQMDEIWIHRPGQWPIPAKITPEENMRIQIQAAKNEALYAINWANDQVGNTTTLEGKEFERKSVYEAVTATRNLYNKMVQFGIKTGTQQSEVASRALGFVKTANHLMSTEIRQFYGVKRNLREAIVMIDSIQLPDLKPVEPKKEEAPFREALETAVSKAIAALRQLDNVCFHNPTIIGKDRQLEHFDRTAGAVKYLTDKMFHLKYWVDLKTQIDKGEALMLYIANLIPLFAADPEKRDLEKIRKIIGMAIKLAGEIIFPETTEPAPAPAPVSYEAALDKAIESLKVAESTLIKNAGVPGVSQLTYERLKEAADNLETLSKRTAMIPEEDKLIWYKTAIATACENLYGAMGRVKLYENSKFYEIKMMIGTAIDTLVALKEHPADDHEEPPKFDIGGEG